MRFYHNLITQKSFEVLKNLTKELDFILIGGWAVWLYGKTLKSKDIDIILNFDQLEILRQKYDLFKNSRLKKYEIKIEEISVDIYVPFYSNLGIPVEEVEQWTKILEGFRVPQKETLLILKQKAYEERKSSLKGRKDLIDIFSLIILPDFAWQLYYKLIERYKLTYLLNNLKNMLAETKEIKELGLNQHQCSRLKSKLLTALKIT